MGDGPRSTILRALRRLLCSQVGLNHSPKKSGCPFPVDWEVWHNKFASLKSFGSKKSDGNVLESVGWCLVTSPPKMERMLLK